MGSHLVTQNFPIPLRINVRRKVHAGQFAGQPLFAVFFGNHILVVVVGAIGVVFQIPQHAFGLFARQRLAATLIVHDRLRGQIIGARNVKFAIKDRIARGLFVDVGRAVANPLAGHEDWQFDVQFNFAHLERGRMPVAH